MELVKPGQKIQAIKLHREQTGVGLRDAKNNLEGLSMKRGPYSWCWTVLGVFLDIIFFGMMGYSSWNYIFRAPDTKWIFVANAWVFLCLSLIVPLFKVYHFAKSLYPKPIKVDRQEEPRFDED